MKPEPKSKYSLDRIDSNGNYEPGNCRWSTWSVQVNNRREYKAIQGFTDAEFLSEASRRGYELQDTVLEYGISGC